jgi:signal transduction histidine kinase
MTQTDGKPTADSAPCRQGTDDRQLACLRHELDKARLYMERTRTRSRRQDRLLQESRIALLNIVRDLEQAQQQEESLRVRVSQMNQVLEERIESRTAQVRRLLEQKDAFVDKLGHDLKTPLTPLVALLPLLKSRCAQDDELRELFDVLISNVGYIRKLVDEILSLTDLSEPSPLKGAQTVILAGEVRKVFDALAGEAARKNVQLLVRDLGTLEAYVNKPLFRQLLGELVTNAIKYSRPGGGRVEISAQGRSHEVLLRIEDDGIGMDPETARQAFGEFFKADQARHDRSSIGLGLSICKHIVEKHSGSIRLESPGLAAGTSVWVTLPSKPDTKADKREAEHEADRDDR